MSIYDSAQAYTFPGKNTPRLRPEQWSAIWRVEDDGARVILEDTGREYVVKVRMPGQRQIRKASTSGYPVSGALEAWHVLLQKDGVK